MSARHTYYGMEDAPARGIGKSPPSPSGQINIVSDILNVPAVIHTREEELLGVAEHDGANARPLKPAVLLDNRDDPGPELAQLRVELTHKLFTARDVEGPRNFLPCPAFMSKPRPFSHSCLTSFLQNLTHATR